MARVMANKASDWQRGQRIAEISDRFTIAAKMGVS
jgi:hypothetical protein